MAIAALTRRSVIVPLFFGACGDDAVQEAVPTTLSGAEDACQRVAYDSDASVDRSPEEALEDFLEFRPSEIPQGGWRPRGDSAFVTDEGGGWLVTVAAGHVDYSSNCDSEVDPDLTPDATSG